MDDLLAEFIAETREMLEASGSELVAWEADPTDRARIDTIFRFVHTVKGNCGFFDFPALEQLSHGAEDALAECRAGHREPDRALVDAVLAIIDRIGEMTDAMERGEALDESTDRDRALLAALATDGEVVEPAACMTQAEHSTSPSSFCQGSEEAGSRHTPAVQRSIRLPVELLDEVMKGVSDMVLARNDLARRLREAGEQPTIDGPFERLSTILADVRNSITRMRMQRLDHLFGSLPRLVRDLSNELGKQVLVDCEGGEVELDREMVDMVRDPLTHVIRNAIDHGIELPSERLEKGKREIGLLTFAARQSGNQIQLVISDDGKGLDTTRLGEKAVAAGVCGKQEFDAMSEDQRNQLIFAPGLSTADTVSAVSGRGVGMDVVRANIEKVGGSIGVTSTPGSGTVITLKLPLTLSIIAALTVRSGQETYAIPQSFVEEIVFGGGENVEFARAGSKTLVTFRGKRIPCVSLAAMLYGSEPETVNWREQTLVLIRLPGDRIFALAVDSVLDHEDVVVKPIAPVIMASKLYAGTTLLDDGRPMMLLDVASMATRSDFVSALGNGTSEPAESAIDEPKLAIPLMLFVAGDGSRRAIRLDLVRRIETVLLDAVSVVNGFAQVVVDGAILPLEGYDAALTSAEKCRLLRLSDGSAEVAYAVRQVVDTLDFTGTVMPVRSDPDLEGQGLIEGRPVGIVNGFSLFARYGSFGSNRPLICRIPENDEWARAILMPLLEQVGFSVATDRSDDIPDLAISIEGTEEEDVDACHRIRLRNAPGQTEHGEIFRYDREAILAALERVRQERAA
ncbi:chemotaxis protein CheA [Erythrobacter litoralis]|uniref:chemotaxis protein CheA n=1 Tax=Erythrobacter litoralis TaxID=39960 RepID=UPI002435DF44|nr:chemotaxis protein CheA [Erythrobacter litoralis]MDG6077845.1 chemotaxis protein CheA [Erythrobacter litoralis]